MKALILLLLLVSSAFATIIPIRSDLMNEGNNVTGTNVFIIPNIFVWEPNHPQAFWISFTFTGLIGGGFLGISPPNVPDPITGPGANAPTATFYESISIPKGEQTKTSVLDVWADDTARVSLLNLTTLTTTLLFEANPVQGPFCSNGPITCFSGGNAHITTVIPSGLSGDFLLLFDVYQRDSSTFGLLYDGTVESATPEPSSAVAMSLGLLAMGLLVQRRYTPSAARIIRRR